MTHRIWISAPQATFGLVSRDGVVIDAAPISRWGVGKCTRVVVEWWQSKGADRVEWWELADW